MSQHLFDAPSDQERKRKMEEMLLHHHADIQRLWRRVGQFPREWIGQLPHASDAFGTTTGTAEGHLEFSSEFSDEFN